MPGLTDQEIAALEEAEAKGLNDDQIAALSQKSYPDEGPGIGRAIAGGLASGLTSGLIQDKASEEAHPIASGAANIAGSIAQGIALPGKRIVDAGTGAVEGFTSTEGSIPAKLGGAAVGAGLGLAFGTAGRKLGGLFKKTLKATEQGAEMLSKKAARNLVGTKATDIYKLSRKGAAAGEDKVDNLIETLRKEGLFRSGTSPEAVHSSALRIKDAATQNLNNQFANLDASGFKLDATEIANKLDDQITELTKVAPHSQADLIKALKNYRMDVLEGENVFGIAPTKLRELTQIVGDSAFDEFGGVKDKAAFSVWQELKDATAGIADKVGGELGANIKAENAKVSAAIKLLPAISKKASREAANAVLPIIGKPLKAASEAAEDRVTKAVLGSTEWLGQNIGKLGKYENAIVQAANRGPRALAATIYRIQQTDEDFRKKHLGAANGAK